MLSADKKSRGFLVLSLKIPTAMVVAVKTLSERTKNPSGSWASLTHMMLYAGAIYNTMIANLDRLAEGSHIKPRQDRG